jgi:hypothetical protein
MADIGPETEMEAFRDDFSIAKSDHARLRYSIVPAFEHLSDSLVMLTHDLPKRERYGKKIMRCSAIGRKTGLPFAGPAEGEGN